MSGAPWHVFGTSQCPQCGADVPVAQLLRGGHRCEPADLEAHEVEQLQARLVVLNVEIAEYLDSPAGRNRLAFAHWCRVHGR